MKKIYTLAVGLFAGLALFAQPYNVTFQVDMNTQTVGDTVSVAGNFQVAA